MPTKRPWWNAAIPLTAPEFLDASLPPQYELPSVQAQGELLGANEVWATIKVRPPQWSDAWELYRMHRSQETRAALRVGKGAWL